MKKKVFGIPTFVFYILLGVSLIGLLFGSLFDLQISKAVVDMDDPVANFYESYGLFFAHAEIEVIIVMLFVGLYKREKLAYRFMGYFILIAANAVLIYIFHKFFWLNPNSKEALFGFRYENRIVVIILSALSLIAIGVLTFFLLNKEEKMANYVLFIGVMMTVALALRFGIGYILKDLGGRPRYRFIYSDIGGDYDGIHYSYRDWWEFAFWKHPRLDYFRSWPSGHTMNAGLTLLLVAFPSVLKKRFKGDVYVFMGVALAYTATMMFYRIRVGAHYLSDVSMGLLISSVLVYLALFFSCQAMEKNKITIYNPETF
ncbi:MAG: phosphatase PAP2 family protein [Bacilli bacterium]|nr:phosphatase PAP2 family protein [Bacilli bacterium]MBQ2052124.1 phosphatase PAP2 family protein [Bacilli bacterium]MBQ4182554.1 phosphatase PAP2 family protein [Bacilli bacterium]